MYRTRKESLHHAAKQGRMRREKVGLGRKPGCQDSQTQKASSVKAKHKNRMPPPPFQQEKALFA